MGFLGCSTKRKYISGHVGLGTTHGNLSGELLYHKKIPGRRCKPTFGVTRFGCNGRQVELDIRKSHEPRRCKRYVTQLNSDCVAVRG